MEKSLCDNGEDGSPPRSAAFGPFSDVTKKNKAEFCCSYVRTDDFFRRLSKDALASPHHPHNYVHHTRGKVWLTWISLILTSPPPSLPGLVEVVRGHQLWSSARHCLHIEGRYWQAGSPTSSLRCPVSPYVSSALLALPHSAESILRMALDPPGILPGPHGHLNTHRV